MSDPLRQLCLKSVPLIAAVLLSVNVCLEAQSVHRLKGSIRDAAGSELSGTIIRAEAIAGFRGQPFAGAKEQTGMSSADGNWSLTGLESGLWMFSTNAEDMLPTAIVLPVKISKMQQVSAIGNSLTWQLPLSASPKNQHAALMIAAELLANRKLDEAAQALTVALGSDVSDDTRVIAGEMALLARNAALANTLFAMVLESQPKHARATLGAASAALMSLDWERAGKLLWAARDLAPKEQRPALAAAIDEVRGLTTAQ